MKPMMSEEVVEPVEEESQGIDGIIATVDSYLENPELVTPETLMELKADLEDLKAFLDGDETPDVPESTKGSLSGRMSQMRGEE